MDRGADDSRDSSSDGADACVPTSVPESSVVLYSCSALVGSSYAGIYTTLVGGDVVISMMLGSGFVGPQVPSLSTFPIVVGSVMP